MNEWISVETRLPDAEAQVVFLRIVDGEPVLHFGYKLEVRADSKLWVDLIQRDQDGQPEYFFDVIFWLSIPPMPDQHAEDLARLALEAASEGEMTTLMEWHDWLFSLRPSRHCSTIRHAKVRVRQIIENERLLGAAVKELRQSHAQAIAALQALGAKPDGYCFCQGEDQVKVGHTGECRQARAVLGEK